VNEINEFLLHLTSEREVSRKIKNNKLFHEKEANLREATGPAE
jgi:hypothetical protein